MKAWSGWVDRVWSTEEATPTALFRIGMGLCTLWTIGVVAWRGLVPILWVDVQYGGYRSLGAGPWLVALMGGPTPGVTWPLVAISLVGAALLTVGIGGRLTALATCLAVNNVTSINGHAGGSYDELLSNGLWLCVIASGDATLSLSAWLRTGQVWPRVQVLAFPRWLVAYQLVLMYCTTGLQKVSAYWVPGGDASALYYILQQPEWQRFEDMTWVAYVYPLTQLATTVTWFWEVTAPVWLVAVWFAADPLRPGRAREWFRRLRVREVYLVTGLVMHALIFGFMDVGPFSPLSLAFYVALYHPFEWERLRTRLGA
jgi:hypothetical protein